MAQVVDTAGKQTVVTPSVTRSHGGGNAGYNPGEDNQIEPSFEGGESSLDEFVANEINRLRSKQSVLGTSSYTASQPSYATPSSLSIEPSYSRARPGSQWSGSQGVPNEPLKDVPSWDSGLDPEIIRGSQPERWEQSSAEREGRDVRTQNVFGEDYDQQQGDRLTGNNQINDAYIRDAMEEGLSYDDAYDIMHRGPWWKVMLDKWNPFDEDKGVNLQSTGDVTVVDDGSTYDYPHMTADQMTGTQYMHYVDMGMGGLPIDRIDPKATYSKRNEQIENGFMPFTPDDLSSMNMQADYLLDMPQRAGSWVAGTRERVMPDYSILYNGDAFSGNDFDRLSTAYMNQRDHDLRFNPSKYLSADGIGEGSTTFVNEWRVPDLSGNQTFHYGDLDGIAEYAFRVGYADGTSRDLTSNDIDLIEQYSDGGFRITLKDGSVIDDDDASVSSIDEYDGGRYLMTFSDGTSVDVDDAYLDSITDGDGRLSLERETVPVGEAGGQLPEDVMSLNDIDDETLSYMSSMGISPEWYANAFSMPDLVLSDGTRIPYVDAERMYYDHSVEDDPDDPFDDGISYEFSSDPLGIIDNKPTRLKNNEIFSLENGFDWSDLGDNVMDWTMSSMPISFDVGMGYVSTPWLYSLANASTSLAGLDPSSYDLANRTYRPINGYYDDEGNLRVGVDPSTYDASAYGDGIIDRLSDPENIRYWNAAMNAVTPLTEEIAGGVHSGMNIPGGSIANVVPWANWWDNVTELPSNPTTWQVLRKLALDAVGEGLEEDVGNVFDELGTYGLGGAWRPNLTREDGTPIYDLSNREVRDYSKGMFTAPTDPTDLVNSFLGGALVDIPMSLMTIPMEGAQRMANPYSRGTRWENTWMNLPPAIRGDLVRRNVGVSQYVDPEYAVDEDGNRIFRSVSDDYKASFSDMIDDVARRADEEEGLV